MRDGVAAEAVDLASGELADFSGTDHPTRIFGVLSDGSVSLPARATHYGFCLDGVMEFRADHWTAHIPERCYFSVPSDGPAAVRAANGFGARGYVASRLEYRGLKMVGGPVEDRGRLRYIDGCSDTLLISPPLLGDPCFNLLHLPPGTDQTFHTHPTLRAGMVHAGRGVCRTDAGVFPLLPGRLFLLYPDAIHAFRTEGESMTLTVYHPDSDFGPSHDEHPMLNRTIVEGRRVNEMAEIRTQEIR